MRWLLVVFALCCGTMQAKPVKHWVASIVVAGTVGLLYNQAVAQQDNLFQQEVGWHKVNKRSSAEHRSVFYLLIDLFDNWRVMPLVYLGNDQRNDPLFVGARMQFVRNGRQVSRYGLSSLVSYQGLVSENVEVQEVATFAHRDDRYFDVSILKIDGVDLSNYQTVTTVPYPDDHQELEMVVYRLDLADDLLHFFSYPSYSRPCQSFARIVDKADRQIVLHDCNVFYTPAVRGTAIFANDKLVALHFGSYRDGLSYAIEIPQQINNFLSLPVEARAKMATTWAEIKQSAIRK